MITRKSNPRAATRAPRTLDPVKGVRGELHDAIRGHRLIASETQNEVSDDLANEAGTLVFIEFGRSGIAVPCLFHSFNHEGEVANVL